MNNEGAAIKADQKTLPARLRNNKKASPSRGWNVEKKRINMKTKKDYIKGFSKMKRNIYYDGPLIDRTDELQMDCINTIGTTYDEAAKPENQDLCTAISHLTGKRINRFTHIHQNTDDLHKKQDMTRICVRRWAAVFSAAWESTAQTPSTTFLTKQTNRTTGQHNIMKTSRSGSPASRRKT